MLSPHLERARQLLHINRYADAGAELSKHLAQDPNDAEAHVLLAICFLNQKKKEEAEDAIGAAINLNPVDAYAFYIYSKILFVKEDVKQSLEKITEAIHINPFAAEFFAWRANLQMHTKDYTDALQSADEGLAIEPDNINCLNIRAIALTKLNRKGEAYDTMLNALTEDPENDMTHANTGWAMLERGEHKKALTHFYEALRIAPQNSWAKSGMVESLKARYWIYRIFLRYMFWIGNLKANVQWAVIIGAYILVKLLQALGNSNPALEPYIIPVVVAYGLFAFSTWIITPLFNLLLFLHPKGRYALDEDERKTSFWVGISLLTGGIALLLFFITENEVMMLIGLAGITLALPISTIYRTHRERSQKILLYYTFGLLILAVATILLAAFGKDYLITGGLYAGGLFVFQFVANSMLAK